MNKDKKILLIAFFVYLVSALINGSGGFESIAIALGSAMLLYPILIIAYAYFIHWNFLNKINVEYILFTIIIVNAILILNLEHKNENKNNYTNIKIDYNKEVVLDNTKINKLQQNQLSYNAKNNEINISRDLITNSQNNYYQKTLLDENSIENLGNNIYKSNFHDISNYFNYFITLNKNDCNNNTIKIIYNSGTAVNIYYVNKEHEHWNNVYNLCEYLKKY